MKTKTCAMTLAFLFAAAAVRRNRQDAADQVLLGDDAVGVGLAAARAVGQLSEPERVRIEVPVLQDRISRTPRGNLVATMTVLECACERCGVDRIDDIKDRQRHHR